MRHAKRQLGQVLAILVLACLLSGPLIAMGKAPFRVLFVGNSLTYFNDLPSAFASLAPSRMQLVVDGFTRPGARLQDDVANPLLRHLLRFGRYDVVVFQERGGDAVGVHDDGHEEDASTSPTLRASRQLADAAREGGARVYYLGTYQRTAKVVPWLVGGERQIARRMGSGYVELGADWHALYTRYPGMDWLAPDGEHPGRAPTALMALRTWQVVMGNVSTRVPCVTGPLYRHAPSADGYFRAAPAHGARTCLVDPGTASVLATR